MKAKDHSPSESLSIDFTIPLPLTNNNQGQTRHWSAANKQKHTFANAFMALKIKASPPDYPQKVVITRILGKGERLWDADSVLRGNAKQLLDSLVDAGYFVDDGPKWIKEVVGRQDETQRLIGPAIRIEIQEINDGGDDRGC